MVLAGISYTRMIGYFGPLRATMITALVPALAALGAVLLLHEAMHWSLAAGLLLVSSGIVLGVQRPGRGALQVGALRRCAADSG